MPTASFANHYAAIVSRYAIFRRLVAIRRGLPQDLVSPAEWAESTQHALTEGQPVALLGLSTGLRELDVALLGLVPSELYVLGARTSAGKTTLLVQIAHHVAIHHGPVLFVSLEMKPELLFDRVGAHGA